MERIIECVPNYSEGRDKAVIGAIVEAISSCGARVLHVDVGEGANRTVVTFVGPPEVVVEAAFQGAAKAAELIDMRRHHGTHPRSGVCDVLPLVPVAGVTLGECVALARALAERIYKEIGMPCYLYEAAALRPSMTALSACRQGEWEALPEKITDSLRRPDFGPPSFNEVVARTGACNVGAREFMIAVNFNLTSGSVPLASEIAAELRESGRVMRDSSGKVLRDPSGKALRKAGRFRHLKAIGWYIEEYGIAQVSMNIYDLAAAPLHEVFEAVCIEASRRGVKVSGTEIIGLVPLQVLLDAGKYFIAKMPRVKSAETASPPPPGNSVENHAVAPSKSFSDNQVGSPSGSSSNTLFETASPPPPGNSVENPAEPPSKSFSENVLGVPAEPPSKSFSENALGVPAEPPAKIPPELSSETSSEQNLLAAAIAGLGLDDLRPFDPRRKVLEYLIRGE